jgi:hypothetical protein
MGLLGAGRVASGLPMESAGHDVTTFVDHEALSSVWGTPTPPGVFGTNCLF